MSVPSNLIPTRIPQLPLDPSPSADGWLIYTNNGITYRVQVSDVVQVSGVPLERQVIAGTGLSGGGQLSADVTLSITPGAVGTTELANSGATPGTYGSGIQVPVLDVDGTGRITSVSVTAVQVIGFVPNSTQIIAGAGLSGGGTLSTDRTLSVSYGAGAPESGSVTASAGVAQTASRSDHVHPAVSLGSSDEVSGVLRLENGGIGGSGMTPVPGGVAYSGADGLYLSSMGLLGQVLVSAGSGTPTWASVLTVSDQAANLVYAGPASGAPDETVFRLLVNADLPNTAVVAGTYGSASVIPVLTVNSKGVVTGVTTQTVSITHASTTGRDHADQHPIGAITGLQSALDGKEPINSNIQNHIASTSNPHSTTAGQVGAEPEFTKNTAFNKDFGSIAGTVTQGNDSRLSNDRVPLVHASDKHSDAYQEPLVSGVNIKTVSGNSLLGSVNIEVELETGFSTNDTIVQVYDPIARTVTLSGIGKMHFKGAEILDVSLGHVSVAHPDVVGPWFYWYNGTAYVWTSSPWTFNDAAMIVYVNYGAVDRFAVREVHGQMGWESHQEFHEQIGTYRRSGGDVTVVTGSAVTANKQPTVTQTVLADEDLPSTLPALGKGAYTHFYLTGAGDVAFSLGNTHIASIDGGSGRLRYNQNNGGTWQFTTINVNNNFHVVYLVGIPATSDATSQAYRYVFFQGQQLYTTLATAQEATFEQLDTSTFALLASEWTVLEKFILRSSNSSNGWTVQQNERVVTSRAQALIGGAGVTSHTLLEDRDALDQHPVASITGIDGDGLAIVSTSLTLGVPSTLTSDTLNAITATSHTHRIESLDAGVF